MARSRFGQPPEDQIEVCPVTETPAKKRIFSLKRITSR